MSSNSKKSLLERIKRSKATRDRLVENNLAEGIAFQIATTRDRRGWTQAELAQRAGIANNLPRLESPDYGKQTLSTLKKLASALDVALIVRLVPFSQYIDWLSGTPSVDEGLRPEALAVPGFLDEQAIGKYEEQPRCITINQTYSVQKFSPSINYGARAAVVIPMQPKILSAEKVA